MIIYKYEEENEHGGSVARHWFSSRQKAVDFHRECSRGRKLEPYHITRIEVGPGKAGLLAFLNSWCVDPDGGAADPLGTDGGEV